MPAVYDKLGIRFQYPENWTLDDTEALAGNRSVTVYSPGGAFWSVAVHVPRRPPQELADEALAAMREVYDELDAEPLAEELAGQAVIGYEMNFYCLDLTSTAWVRSFERPWASYVLFCQGEDRELAAVEPVFRAMTLSLLQHGTAPPREA